MHDSSLTQVDRRIDIFFLLLLFLVLFLGGSRAYISSGHFITLRSFLLSIYIALLVINYTLKPVTLFHVHCEAPKAYMK